MFMSIAIPFELQIQAFWHPVILVLQFLTSLYVSAPGAFFSTIGLSTLPSDPFMSFFYSHQGYSIGKFQALKLIVLAAFAAVDYPLALCMLVHIFGSLILSHG